MYKLLIEDDEGGKTVVPVIRDEITIGRKEGNTIRLTERNVSRRHGRLIRDDGRLYVEDISARYGLKKNGKAIAKREEFREGDVLVIGDYRLTLQAEKAPNLGPPKKKIKAPMPEGVSDLNEASTTITNLEDMKRSPREATMVMPAMPAKIVVISSNFAGQEFPLNQPETVIGRGDDCHIIIDHRSISQKHAKIVREDSTTYKIVDLNSKNGVKVSGEEYRATHLKRGDILELGHVKFRFVEPGENYVFTPQSSPAGSESWDDSPSPAGSSGKGKLFVLTGVVVVALIAAVFLLIPRDTGTSATQGTAEPATPVAAVAPAAEAAPFAPAGDDRIGEALDRARADITDGNLQRAIGSLESARDYLNPSPEQQNEIGDLLSKARNEQPFQRAYASAQELVGAEQFKEALSRLNTIPSHSLFQDKISVEGLADKALKGVVAEAQAALKANETNTARTLAEEALAFRSDYAPAQDVLNKIEEQQRTVAARTATPAANPASSKPKTNNAAPQRARLTPAEAQELFVSASRKNIGGDPQGAISDCLEALRNGHTACHRVLGVAYGQLNNTDRACHHYSQYLRTNPRNTSTIESQMERLGCSR